jgi:hypothetical protein
MIATPAKIARNIVLKELDIKWLPNGNRHTFSIKFVDKQGKLRFIPKAYSCGLRMNMKQHRVRGIQPCCQTERPEGHIIPVGIDRIVMYNQMEVIL